jgi:valyl-tRNA synthetase
MKPETADSPHEAAPEFPSRYDPKPVEGRWYEYWEKNGFFKADSGSAKKPFCVVIPPPNVTGSLHVGHALNNTLQDIVIRMKKLQGYETLWLPGTDHASIGTHTHLDRQLAKEGTNRFELGREEFLKRAWAWKEKYGNRIVEQLKLLGCACDWSRTRFTMDEMLSKAVREAFVRYYEEGLIYRGNRIVNWCPRCHTAISDLEVKHQEQKSSLWYIKYPRVDGQGFVVVATTRPETMLGDTAVAVNPDDTRYKDLVGKKLILPLANREIPVIADDLVLADFGTGAVKVTPAHDATDFEIGRKHKLESVAVISDMARMTDAVPEKYRGLSREECRKQVVQDLEAAGLMEKIEPYKLSASICERCGTVTEPLTSEQWFLKMKDLAAPAIKIVEEGRVRFIPERWTKVYLDWMYNVRDWCISRQLWWGHRIPVFYCDDCGEIMVARLDPVECRKCGSKKIRQDEDILDTWFSSALWPFSTLGWPDKNPDLAKFYPTNFLSTAPDIIFLWVARMIFSGLKFMGDIPFSDVYFHSFILVETGERMSRSKGIGLDPAELFDKYGTDAVRFTLTYLESQSQSYRLSEKRFEFGRNFTNKIWNAARLLYPHIGPQSSVFSSSANSADSGIRNQTNLQSAICNLQSAIPVSLPSSPAPSLPALAPVDKWILSRYNRVVKIVTEALSGYAYSTAAGTLYEFFWHEFCDWYLEFAKTRMKADDPACRWTLYQVLSGSLRLMHPMMPFITEELWQRFGFARGQPPNFPAGNWGVVPSIMSSTWPEPIPNDEAQAEEVELMRELIVGIRNIRSEMNVAAGAKVACLLNPTDPELGKFMLAQRELIAEQAKVSELKLAPAKPPHSSLVVLKGLEAYIPLEGLIDFDKEQARLQKDLANAQDEIARIDQRLQDANFVNRAKPEIVERERERRAALEERETRLRKTLESL